MADPQVVGLPSKITYFDQQDEAKQAQTDFLKLSPDHEEASAALNSAKALAPMIHPQITLEHPTTVASELYGKPLGSEGLWEKIKGTVQGFINHSEANSLVARQLSNVVATGKEDPELQKKIDEAQKNADPKAHLKAIPETILQLPLSLGYDLLQAGSFVADNIAALLTLEPIRRTMGLGAGTKFYEMGEKSGERLMGSFSGATYSGLRQEGIPPNIAAPFSIGGGLLMAALYGLKVEKIPGVGPLMEKAGLDATSKAAVGGRFSRTAKTLVTSGGIQGVLGALTAGVNDTVYELAAITNNLVNQNKVPLKSIQQFGEDMGISGLAGMVFGVAAGIPGAVAGIIPGGHLDMRIHEEAAKIEEAQRAAARPETKITPEQNRAAYDARMAQLKELHDSLQSKMAQVKDPEQRRLTQQRIDDLSKQLKTPFDINLQYFAPKPEDVTLGNLFADEQAPKITEGQGAALDKATRSEEGTADYIKKQPEIERLNTRIEDLEVRGEEYKGQLEAARSEKADAVKTIRDQMKLRQNIQEAMVQARKIRDKIFSNVNKIVKSAPDLPDEYRGPLEAVAGRINAGMGNDPRPISGLRDIGELLGDHGKHPFSSWDETDVKYLAELSKKNADMLTAGDLMIIHDAINDFKMEHDLEREIKVQGKKIAKQIAAGQMKSEVNKRTPEQLKARVEAMNGRPAMIDKVWDVLRVIGKEEIHFSNLVEWLSGGEDSLTHRVIAGEVEKGHIAFRERVNRWGELHGEWFKKNGIDQFDFLREKRKVQVAEDGETRDLTTGYVISAYKHSLREDNSASFKAGTSIQSDKYFNIVKMSDRLIQKMFDEMTPQDKEYADHLTSVVAQVSKELDDAHYARYERHPQMLENYWRISRITETMTRIQDRKFQGIDIANPDIFRHRTGAVTPIYWRSAERDLFDLFNRAGRWIDMGEEIGHARSMLAEISLDLRKQQGNDKATNMVAKGLAAYAGKNSTPEELEKVLLKMRSMGTQSVLGGLKVTTMVKNAALGIRSIPYVGFLDWAGAAKDVLAHPKLYHELWLERSGLYEDISRSGGTKEMQDVFLAETRHPKLRRILLAFEMAGFRSGSRTELESVHRYALRQFKKGIMEDAWLRRAVETHLGHEVKPEEIKGWTPEERDVLATQGAEALLKRNHMTTSPGFQANVVREGPVGILAATLQSEKLAGVNMVVSAWMDAPHTKNGYKTAIKASIIHFIAEPAIMAAIRVGWLAALGGGAYALLRKKRNAPAETVKQRIARLGSVAKDEVFADWFSNILMGGDMYYITKQAIQMAKRGTGGGGLTLIGQYPEDFLNIAAGISAVGRAKSNQAKFNAALSLGIDSMTLIGMMTGLPIKGLADTGIGAFESIKEAGGGK
jgi:hypothetical protein